MSTSPVLIRFSALNCAVMSISTQSRRNKCKFHSRLKGNVNCPDVVPHSDWVCVCVVIYDVISQDSEVLFLFCCDHTH